MIWRSASELLQASSNAHVLIVGPIRRHAGQEIASRSVTGAGWRTVCKYPPFCADIGSTPIITRIVQMWAFCAARPSPACDHPDRA
jgi:hypothetical protein